MTGESRPLTPEEAEQFGAALDAIRREVRAELGAKDVEHIRGVIRWVHRSELAGRVLLHVGVGPLSFVAGVAALATSKILENMEVGHNVMHGQYDWTGDPALASATYDWDNVVPAADWRQGHNYEHHTFTNILGRDRDIGFSFVRIAPEQPWDQSHTLQPLTAAAVALLFQWGVAIHGLHLPDDVTDRAGWRAALGRSGPLLRKAGRKLAKDYVFYPGIALFNAPRVLVGNLLANSARNVWASAIIFCGHFPDGVKMFTVEEAAGESRGQWYVRQLNGSANLEGGRWFHLLSGHLSYQVEHHLFPELPASRYPELAPRVRELCERFGQVYRTGSLRRQLGSVVRRLVEHSRPTRPAALAVDGP
jgi:NADPH-dependent stearoyl-CoA 9-desaturase